MIAPEDPSVSPFVRRTKPKARYGVDYTCGGCGRHVGPDKWSMYFDPQMKLVMTAHCCGVQTQFRIWLDMGGVLAKD